jgi:GT2 family glycosyltransferase
MTNTLEIVIPTYGPSPYLVECLKSIIDNTDADQVKCTILDDCTPGQVVESIVRMFPDRFIFVKNESNLGLASNFQKAFDISTSDYTLIIGSDDRITENLIRSTLEAANIYPQACLIHPKVKVIDDSGKQVRTIVDFVKSLISPRTNMAKEFNGELILRRLLIGDFMYFPSIAWQTDIVREFRLNSKLRTAVDLDLLLRLAIAGNKFVFTGSNGFEYRRHKQSISSLLAQDATRANEEKQVQKEIKGVLKRDGRILEAILADIAPTIRIHSFMRRVNKKRSKA